MNFEVFTMVWMGVLIHLRPNGCPLEMDCTYLFILTIKFYQTHISFIFSYTLELSVKSCPIGLDPSFDPSSLPGCCPQSHEILLNKGLKYWDPGLNARNTRTFIATVHIAAAVIGWRRSGKERTVQTQFSTKFAAKLGFMPRWNSVYFFPPVFWNLMPYATKQEVPVPSFPDFFTDKFNMFLILMQQPLSQALENEEVI